MEFLYDHTGVFAVIFNGTTYFYRKNGQGDIIADYMPDTPQRDIIAILDNEGQVVVKYTYDAWGNTVIEVLDCNANVIAELNPFRYRSYVAGIKGLLNFVAGAWTSGAGLWNIPKGAAPGALNFCTKLALNSIIDFFGDYRLMQYMPRY